MHPALDQAELDGGERHDDDHEDHRLGRRAAEIERHLAVVIDLVDQDLRRLSGAAGGYGMNDAEGVEVRLARRSAKIRDSSWLMLRLWRPRLLVLAE